MNLRKLEQLQFILICTNKMYQSKFEILPNNKMSPFKIAKVFKQNA